MHTRLRWTRGNTVAMVQNTENAGPPWIGVVRYLVDKWRATLTVGEAPVEIGRFNTAAEAHEAIVSAYEHHAAVVVHGKSAFRHARACAA